MSWVLDLAGVEKQNARTGMEPPFISEQVGRLFKFTELQLR